MCGLRRRRICLRMFFFTFLPFFCSASHVNHWFWLTVSADIFFFFKHSWEQEQFHNTSKYQRDMQRSQRPDAGMEPNKEERKEYEADAKKLLDGSKAWRPTWQALGLNYDRTTIGKRS